jgi:NAD-dependent deacetylase
MSDVATTTPDPGAFAAAADALRHARRVVALSGAGISRESGLPTFRETQTGLWARFRPEELATPDAFARDPGLVWRWYAWRRRLVADAAPNAAHYALVTLARHIPHFTLVTQNIDGLHQRAGSDDVIELHGAIRNTRCAACDRAAPAAPLPDDEPPRCACGGLFRPDVVWFGEMLPPAALARASEEALSCDVFLAIGTSGIVYPAAGLAASAFRTGAAVISINPDPAAAPPGAVQLSGSAGCVLPALVAAAWAAPS